MICNEFTFECVPNQISNRRNESIYLHTSYGYPYGTPSAGYVVSPTDVTVSTTSYKQNVQDDTMELESLNNKGKSKIKKLSNGFAITNRVENFNDSGEIIFAIVSYNTRTHTDVTIIPGGDYINGKYEKHFEHIIRLPGSSKAELNALIGFELKAASCQKLKLYPHQGINEFENGVIGLGGSSGFSKELSKYISPGILKRKGLVDFAAEEQVKANWVRIFGNEPVICYLSNCYIMSLLLYFLNSSGIYIKDFLCIKPSNAQSGLTNEKLISMLSTNNFHQYQIPSLQSGEDVIEREYSEIYDGVFLLEDVSFADEEHKIINGIKTVIKCTRKRAKSGRNFPMIISKNAGYTAAKLAPENVVLIETDGVELNCTAEEIERITDEMTALIYIKSLSNTAATKEFFAQKVPMLHQALSEYANGDKLDTLTGMMAIELFLRDFLVINRYSNDLLDYYLKIINYKEDRLMSANKLIKNELGTKLSEKFRSKDFRAVKKSRNMRIEDDGKTAVLSGNRLLVSSGMLNSIVPDMDSTHSSDSVITAFKNEGDLICTDGDTHPFDSHDCNGKYQRLYFYDIPSDILDEDVLYILNNPEIAAFLLTKEESKIASFMPLMSDKSGKIVGKRFIYNDVENDSIAIYGQAGEGKSYTTAQIMASRFARGYDILVFDTSDSDTYDALCANLSKKFVDENVVFHSLDHKELDLNIFNIDRTASIPSQKREMLGIITAGIGDLSVPQTNLLRSKISDLLEVTDVGKKISPDNLLTLLDEEGTASESLRNRLESFIEDIKEYGLASGTWKDFFCGDHKIHIVQIDESFSENGNQIVDVLLASLFNYKRENPQRPLSVFIDEVQNHNMSVTSPIRKILKEGRKSHLSIVTATQDFYARGTDIGSALGKAGMQIFHRPTQNSATLVAAELRWNKADMARFDTMERGDTIIKGFFYNKELKRNVQTTMCGHICDFLTD